MKLLKRDKGDSRWTVDLHELEGIHRKATELTGLELDIEGTEATIMAMVEMGYCFFES